MVRQLERCMDYQAVNDSLQVRTGDIIGTNADRSTEAFRGMTTASIISYLRAQVVQREPLSLHSSKVTNKAPCHSIMDTLGKKTTLCSLPSPPRLLHRRRLDLLAAAAGSVAADEFQSGARQSAVDPLWKLVKPATMGRFQRRSSDPRPLGLPPRLPCLKSGQIMKRRAAAIRLHPVGNRTETKKKPVVIPPDE